MKKIPMVFLVLSLAFIGILAPIQPSTADTKSVGDLLDQALESIAMERSDLSMRSDFFENPLVSERFKEWMNAPLKAPHEIQERAKTLFQTAKTPSLWLQNLARFADLPITNPLEPRECPGLILPGHLPQPLSAAIRLLVNALYTAEMRLAEVRRGLTDEEWRLMEDYLFPDQCMEGGSEREMPAVGRTKKIREALATAARLDMRGVLEAGLMVLRAVEKAMSLLAENRDRPAGLQEDWGDISTFSLETPVGLLVIGGPGPDIHEGPAALILELGGNDLYRGRTASGVDGRCSLVLDLSGDDLYLGEDRTQGSGVFGIGILVDLQGNDLYRAGNCSQGAGLFGLGLLLDLEGGDRYLGGEFVQAASWLGWGGLIDLDGEDVYQCRQSGQAYAGPGGSSCLCDLKGNDRYISGSETPDPREPDMNQSFSQGFATGIRNLSGGGFALLADREGNDLYQCQYFGQGSAYWMAVGALYDETGNDTYVGRRYAQGAGIHYALGVLLDVEGNDHTVSWAVSQGCGHDYGIGILINETGDDTYVSDWLSMGASEANGIGVFVDNSGNDGYDSKSGLAVGNLTKSRRAGGLGLFLDAGGTDRYGARGKNNTLWGDTRWAAGKDAEAGGVSGLNLMVAGKESRQGGAAEKERDKEKVRVSKVLERAEELPFQDRFEEILSVASHWGLEEEIPQKARDEILGMDPERSVPAMSRVLDTPDVMTLLFMEKFFTIHAFHARGELEGKTSDPDPQVRSRAFYHLAVLKDTRTLPYCLDALKDPSWKVRASAIRAVGEILDRRRLNALEPMKDILLKALRAGSPACLPEVEQACLERYLDDNEKAAMLLSVLARAIPLPYERFQKYSEIPGNGEPRKVGLEEYTRFVFDNVNTVLPLVDRWIQDIKESSPSKDGVTRTLMGSLQDPDPFVKGAAAYALGQMEHSPALPRLISLLQDHDRSVRDASALALALFGEKAFPSLDLAMKGGSPALKILGMDILGRIPHPGSMDIIRGYVDDPHQDVRRAARAALSRSGS